MKVYEPSVVESISHDPTAFTQGLELYRGDLLESVGGYGDSALSRYRGVGPETSVRVSLDAAFFGEDICVVDDQMIQLTWRESVALRWSLPELAPIGKIPYDHEGWGICADSRSCYTSDGSAEIMVRDRASFRPKGSLAVRTPDGRPITGLNALSCAGDVLWANRVQSCQLFEINSATGLVMGTLDLWDLFMNHPRGSGFGANGVVIDDSGGERTLWVTGKGHPELMRLRLHEH